MRYTEEERNWEFNHAIDYIRIPFLAVIQSPWLLTQEIAKKIVSLPKKILVKLISIAIFINGLLLMLNLFTDFYKGRLQLVSGSTALISLLLSTGFLFYIYIMIEKANLNIFAEYDLSQSTITNVKQAIKKDITEQSVETEDLKEDKQDKKDIEMNESEKLDDNFFELLEDDNIQGYFNKQMSQEVPSVDFSTLNEDVFKDFNFGS